MNAFAKALREGKFSVGKVCTDCVMTKENGDPTGNAPDWDEVEFDAANSNYDATIGHPHGNQWHMECSHWETPCPDDADCDCERDPFSTTQCAMCGTYLHGERHDYIFIERALL